MTALHDLNTALAAVADTAHQATVRIGRDGRASGTVIADGIVLTNAHAMRDRTTQVSFADGRTSQAELLATDADGDLVTLSVDTSGVAPLIWAEAEPLQGHFIVAGHGDGSVAVGSVAASGRTFRGPRGRSVANALEHTASLARGASGGPVVDADGRLVALNTNRTEAGYQAVSLVGPTRQRVEALLAGQSFHRRQLGVALAPAGVANAVRKAAGLPEITGLLVRSVVEDSPAARSGLAEGDVIVAANGSPTDQLEALATALDGASETVVLRVVRGVEERDVTVDFTAPEGAPPRRDRSRAT